MIRELARRQSFVNKKMWMGRLGIKNQKFGTAELQMETDFNGTLFGFD